MRWFTTTEAAKKLGYDDSHVRRLIGSKKLKAKRVGGKVWMISEQVLNTFIKKRSS